MDFIHERKCKREVTLLHMVYRIREPHPESYKVKIFLRDLFKVNCRDLWKVSCSLQPLIYRLAKVNKYLKGIGLKNIFRNSFMENIFLKKTRFFFFFLHFFIFSKVNHVFCSYS